MAQDIKIQWFPGHMAKTRRLITENLKLVDIAAELLDARIPYSSGNPEIDRLLGNKPRIVLLNKSDLADPRVNEEWVAYFRERGIATLETDCRTGKGLAKMEGAMRTVLSDVMQRRESKGMSIKNIRVMIVGVPNVGKSTLINKLAGKKRAKVEDRPGVTRTKQWVKIGTGLDLLDMPGVLWPKFEEQKVGLNLAFTGAIKDDVIDIETLGMHLLEFLATNYPEQLEKRYKITSKTPEPDGAALLDALGRARGMLLPGGVVNTERASITLIDEFRAGQIGKISLERPPEAGKKSLSESAVRSTFTPKTDEEKAARKTAGKNINRT